MGKLQDLLDKLLEDAKGHDKVPQTRKLEGGLHITMTAYRESIVLAISRDETYPSEKEWETVCKNYPYYIGKPTPIKFTDNNRRFAMRAEVPTRQAVALKLL